MTPAVNWQEVVDRCLPGTADSGHCAAGDCHAVLASRGTAHDDRGRVSCAVLLHCHAGLQRTTDTQNCYHPTQYCNRLPNTHTCSTATDYQTLIQAVLPLNQTLIQAVLPLYKTLIQTVLPFYQTLRHAVLPLYQTLRHAALPLYQTLGHAVLPLYQNSYTQYTASLRLYQTLMQAVLPCGGTSAAKNCLTIHFNIFGGLFKKSIIIHTIKIR